MATPDSRQVPPVEKRRPPAAGMGRRKGCQNKVTRTLKEAILMAAEEAGGEGGLVGYLKTLAIENPAAFAFLLGKVLPMTLASDAENPVQIITEIRNVIVEPTASADRGPGQ